MATNLRLSEQAAEAVREEAKRTGRSQQDVIRAAVDQYLEPKAPRPLTDDIRGQIIPPLMPFVTIPKEQMLKLPDGASSLDLLDREDRI